jgi:hypothetical protein
LKFEFFEADFFPSDIKRLKKVLGKPEGLKVPATMSDKKAKLKYLKELEDQFK